MQNSPRWNWHGPNYMAAIKPLHKQEAQLDLSGGKKS
jgi:hypothetical protein